MTWVNACVNEVGALCGTAGCCQSDGLSCRQSICTYNQPSELLRVNAKGKTVTQDGSQPPLRTLGTTPSIQDDVTAGPGQRGFYFWVDAPEQLHEASLAEMGHFLYRRQVCGRGRVFTWHENLMPFRIWHGIVAVNGNPWAIQVAVGKCGLVSRREKKKEDKAQVGQWRSYFGDGSSECGSRTIAAHDHESLFVRQIKRGELFSDLADVNITQTDGITPATVTLVDLVWSAEGHDDMDWSAWGTLAPFQPREGYARGVGWSHEWNLVFDYSGTRSFSTAAAGPDYYMLGYWGGSLHERDFLVLSCPKEDCSYGCSDNGHPGEWTITVAPYGVSYDVWWPITNSGTQPLRVRLAVGGACCGLECSSEGKLEGAAAAIRYPSGTVIGTVDLLCIEGTPQFVDFYEKLLLPGERWNARFKVATTAPGFTALFLAAYPVP